METQLRKEQGLVFMRVVLASPEGGLAAKAYNVTVLYCVCTTHVQRTSSLEV